MTNKLKLLDIKIIWDKEMFGIEFTPWKFKVDVDSKHGQIILKRRKVLRI